MAPLAAVKAWLFPGKPKFPEVEDLAGKTVLVTGGNTGIGFEMCRILLAKNAKVYLAARSSDKGEQAIAKLKQETGKENIHFLHLNLASLASCRSAAQTFISQESSLHILFLNAGMTSSKPGEVTEDGYESQFGTNVLGHHVFTMHLMDLLCSTAKNAHVRVICTGSFAQYTVTKEVLAAETLKSAGSLNSDKLYGRSKLGNSVWTKALALRYGSQGINAYCVHPGVIATDMFQQRAANQMSLRLMLNLTGYPTTAGANQVVWVGTNKEIEKDENGSFYAPWKVKIVDVDAVNDVKLRDGLWDWLEEQRNA